MIIVKDSKKERGRVTCLNATTGKTEWESRLPKSVKVYYSSPILSGNKLYVAREDGVILCGTVTDDGLKDVKESALGEGVIASLALVNNRLLIRGDTHLFCVGKK